MEISIFLPLWAKSIRWNRLALSFQQLECLKLDFDTISESILMNDLASNQKNLSVSKFFQKKWKFFINIDGNKSHP